MAENIGWIRLYRKVQECELWDGDEPFDRRSAWIDLLLMANHKDKRTLFNGHPITIKKGQRLTSIRKLAARWHWGIQRTMNFLKLLENLEMITRDSDNNRTLLTIVNYGVYNDLQNTNKNSNENTDENADGTQAEHQQEHQQDTNKNEKNDKNEKKSKDKPARSRFGEYNHILLSHDEFQKLCEQHGEVATLKAIKKVDEYCERSGKSYKNYYLTICKWGFEEDRSGAPAKVKGADELQASYDMINSWHPKEG